MTAMLANASTGFMRSLSVRKLDDETYERLRVKAAKAGASMEELARRILTNAVAAPERMGDFFLAQFGTANGIDLPLEPREPHEPIDLEP